MTRRLALTVPLCFGLGLALARVEPVALASKCNGPAELALHLDRIEGDGDRFAELAFWSRDAMVSAFGPELVINVDGESQSLQLEQP